MTQLPFEDLPVAKKSNHKHVDVLFNEWWPIFWEDWPHKVDKQQARKEFRIALRITSPEEIIEGRNRYIANKPDWQAWMGPAKFLRRRRWEDEYDSPVRQPPPNDGALRIIAAHAQQSWCERGKYTRDVLQRCVDAGLLTQEEAEAVL